MIQRKRHFILTVAAAILAMAPFVTFGSESGDLSVNEKLVKSAWDSYNARDFDAAISYARECVDRFKADADRDQAVLLQKKVQIPKKGQVSKAEMERIMKRGLLNDVATAFFIIGQSSKNLSKLDSARQAFEHCADYTYARTWDPNGWFWNPSQACKDGLRLLY